MTKVKKIWFIVILTLSFTLLCVGSAFLVSSFCGNQETISPTAEVGENKLHEHDCDCDHCHDDCEDCDGCDHCHKENEYEQGSLASVKLSSSTTYYKNNGKFYTRTTTSQTTGGRTIWQCTVCGDYGAGLYCYHDVEVTCSTCHGTGKSSTPSGDGEHHWTYYPQRPSASAYICDYCGEMSPIPWEEDCPNNPIVYPDCSDCHGTGKQIENQDCATRNIGTTGGTTTYYYTYTNIDNSSDVVSNTTDDYEVATGFWVAFDKNASGALGGGTPSGSMSNQWFLHGHWQYLNSNNYSLSNHTMAGWGTTSNATSINYYNTNGLSRSTSEVAVNGTLTLYAYWQYQVSNPTLTSDIYLDYDGTEKTLGISYNSTYVEVTGNKATAAGSYVAVCKLKNKSHTVWASSGGTSDITYNWRINVIGYGVNLEFDISPTEYTYDGNAKTPTVSNVKQKFSEAWNGSAATQPAGSGTESDPYLISKASELRWIRNNGTKSSGAAVGKYFLQTDNIDLNNKAWTPIGYWDSGCTSSFHYDGGGYVIKGLYINQSGSRFRGLFHRLCSGSYVKNLTVYGSITASSYSGGVVGELRDGGSLDNVHSYVDCTFYGSMGGGIIGLSYATSFYNCSFHGTIRCCQYRAGGIVGYSQSTYVYGCSNYGTITIDTSLNTATSSSGNADTYSRVGGVAGECGRDMYDCANYGTIQSSSTFSETCYVGGITGYYGWRLTRCFNVGTISFSSTTNVQLGAMSGSGTPNSDCYYLNGCGVTYGEGGTSTTTGRLSASSMKSTSNGTKPSSFDSGYSSSGYWAFVNGQYPKNTVDYNYAPLYYNYTNSDYTITYQDNTMPSTEAKVILTTREIRSQSGKVMLAATPTVKTFTIKGLNFTPNCSMTNYMYNGSLSTPAVSNNTSGGTPSYYYNTTNSNSGGTAWSSITSSTSLNPGLYYMYVVVAANGIYAECKSAAVPFYVYVETPTLNRYEYEYTGNTINNTASYNSNYINTPTGLSGQNYGTYPVTFTTKSANYLFINGQQTYSSISWNITTAVNTIQNFSISNWSYGGTASNPTGTAKWGTITYSYKESKDPDSSYTTTKPTDAGDYVVRAVSQSSGNNYSAQTLTLSFSISKQKIAKVIIAQNPTYSGEPVSPTLSSSYSDSAMAKSGDVSAKNVKLTGSYKIIISITNENYCWSDDSVDPISLDWNVSPADISSATVELGQTAFIYDGQKHEPDVTVTPSND